MDMASDPAREEWRAWARQLAGDDHGDEIAQAALEALAVGASVEQAAALARVRAGRAAWTDHELLNRSLAELDAGLRLSDSLTAGGALTPDGLEEVRSQLRRRLLVLTPHPQGVAASAGARSVTPRPSLREFLAERSIQLLAYSGAFLLAVAVLLFDLSGSSPSRFFAVAGLCLLFAVGGALAVRRESLRTIARAYVALAALLLPLVALAAYVFLGLGPAGVPRRLAVAVSAASCAVTYGILARVLASRAYGAMSVLALAIAVGAATAWLAGDRWVGASLAGLGLVYAVGARWKRPGLEPFHGPALVGAHALPPLGGAWAAAWLYDQATGNLNPTNWPLSLALVLGFTAYLVLAAGHRRVAVLPALWLAAAAYSLAHDFQLSPTGSQAAGIAVALVWLAAALPPVDERLGLDVTSRTMLRLLATTMMVAISWPAFSAAWPQAAFALLSTAAVIYVAVQSRTPPWLLGAGVLATAAWYWLAQAVLPARPNATAADLALVLSPLPVIFASASLALRQRWSRSWAWPLQACFAVLGLGVPAMALTQPGWLVAGASLLVYAALGYAIALVERQAWALAISLLAALAGMACLLANRQVDGDLYLLALAGFGAAVYLGVVPVSPRSTPVGPVHRYLAQACLGLAAIAAVFTATRPGTLAACAAAAALVLGLDAWLSRLPQSEYLAALAASLLGIALARQLALGDVQYQVVLPGMALIAVGVRAAFDERLPERLMLGRLATAAGCLVLFGTSAYQSADFGAGNDARSGHSAWLAVEGAAGLVASVGLRSRTLAVASALALGWAALMAVSLLAQVVPLSVIFGGIALVLIVAATGLALVRGRFGDAAATARSSWSTWL